MAGNQRRQLGLSENIKNPEVHHVADRVCDVGCGFAFRRHSWKRQGSADCPAPGGSCRPTQRCYGSSLAPVLAGSLGSNALPLVLAGSLGPRSLQVDKTEWEAALALTQVSRAASVQINNCGGRKGRAVAFERWRKGWDLPESRP